MILGLVNNQWLCSEEVKWFDDYLDADLGFKPFSICSRISIRMSVRRLVRWFSIVPFSWVTIRADHSLHWPRESITRIEIRIAQCTELRKFGNRMKYTFL